VAVRHNEISNSLSTAPVRSEPLFKRNKPQMARSMFGPDGF
jgi:hypothetical protein